MPSGSNQPPQPCKGGREDMEHTHDTVARVLLGTRWGAYAKAPHVYFDGVGNNARDHPARQNNPWVRAGLAI